MPCDPPPDGGGDGGGGGGGDGGGGGGGGVVVTTLLVFTVIPLLLAEFELAKIHVGQSMLRMKPAVTRSIWALVSK
jgi:hypothetical protein